MFFFPQKGLYPTRLVSAYQSNLLLVDSVKSQVSNSRPGGQTAALFRSAHTNFKKKKKRLFLKFHLPRAAGTLCEVWKLFPSSGSIKRFHGNGSLEFASNRAVAQSTSNVEAIHSVSVMWFVWFVIHLSRYYIFRPHRHDSLLRKYWNGMLLFATRRVWDRKMNMRRQIRILAFESWCLHPDLCDSFGAEEKLNDGVEARRIHFHDEKKKKPKNVRHISCTCDYITLRTS